VHSYPAAVPRRPPGKRGGTRPYFHTDGGGVCQKGEGKPSTPRSGYNSPSQVTGGEKKRGEGNRRVACSFTCKVTGGGDVIL